MKKHFRYYLVYLLSLTLLTSCGDDEDTGKDKYDFPKVNFPSLEEKLTFTDYMTLPIESEAYKNSQFSPLAPAIDFLPSWLSNKYFNPSEGSIAWVSYNYNEYVVPTEIDLLTGLDTNVLTITDFNDIWGDIAGDFFTPSKPESLMTDILDKKLTGVENQYYVISYYYSNEEATIKDDEIIYLNENFNSDTGGAWSVLNVASWYSRNTMGGRPWRINVAGINKIPLAYDRDYAGSDAWLINKTAINLTKALKPILSFKYGCGYFVTSTTGTESSFDCMYLKVSDNFDGENPSSSTWDDLSEESGIRSATKAPAYPGTATFTMDLSAYAGKNFFVGFNYYLPQRSSKYTVAPLYYVDDIKISEIKKTAISNTKEKKHALYAYRDDQWINETEQFYLLQPTDYTALGIEALSKTEAEVMIPKILTSKFSSLNLGNKKLVIYTSSSGKTLASEFTFTIDGWALADIQSVTMTDKYVYKKQTGWTFESNSISTN